VKRRSFALWAADNARHAATFRDKVDAFLSDAQVGLAFLTPQLYRIETEVYMTRYPSFDINRFMSVDTSGDMWDVGTLVYSMDQVGQAEFFAGGAFDMPYASSKMAQNVANFHLAGIGYEWNTQEMQRAAMLGRSLSSDKAGGQAGGRSLHLRPRHDRPDAARRIREELDRLHQQRLGSERAGRRRWHRIVAPVVGEDGRT
jgi:hypothetical protein